MYAQDIEIVDDEELKEAFINKAQAGLLRDQVSKIKKPNDFKVNSNLSLVTRFVYMAFSISRKSILLKLINETSNLDWLYFAWSQLIKESYEHQIQYRCTV